MGAIQKLIRYRWLLWGFWGFFISTSGAQSFDEWKRQFYDKAVTAGVSEVQLTRFLQVTPYEAVLAKDKNQAEFKRFLWDYLGAAVSDARVVLGKNYFLSHQPLLHRVAALTGVKPAMLVAIWGIESKYGQLTGKTPVVRAMATLAYDGRRRHFFETELLALLQLIDRGDVPRFDIEGSWAGGLGMAQFMPSSYLRYGVDDNRDGFVNLWQPQDALASIGNYLDNAGWQKNIAWGQVVALADGFDYLLANDSVRRPLRQWQKLGVKSLAGQALPDPERMARLFVPAGQFGPKFLLYENFDVIKRYNNSDAYALAIGLLSDRISGRVPTVMNWPQNAQKLTVSDVKKVQEILNTEGFDVGEVDGVFGNNTRRALQAYQFARGQVADGFLSQALYRQILGEH